jgi:hypothetical protein
MRIIHAVNSGTVGEGVGVGDVEGAIVCGVEVVVGLGFHMLK